jgi:two-component system OmpR family sensor kinase
LLIVMAVIAVTYVVTAAVAVSTQRATLIEQVDRRISLLPPDIVTIRGAQNAPWQAPAGEGGGSGTGASGPGESFESPFSDLYVGVLNPDGTTTDLLVGSLLDTRPSLETAVDVAGGAARIVTIHDDAGVMSFRAAVIPQPGGGEFVVAAEPLTETNAAIARLKRTLWIAGAVIAVVLGTAFVWVQRLGLTPIARVTDTAEAISAGETARRVEVANRRTEAGKLGHAFNLMLDQRDAAESRLRQFVADASHELRTPLTSVRGYLELYRQGAFREQRQLDDIVRRLSAETARMNGLVEDLFALSSLDDHRPLHRETVDLGQLLRDLAQDAQATQPERAIAVEAPEEGPAISGDAALLTQLAGNLVANALAHTPVEAPLTLSARVDDGFATLVVADGGPGLDAEAAAHVFDRFWRGDASRSRGATGGHRGAGLGLSIARSIAEAHDGSIALETAPGSGCTFTVRLPVDLPAGPGAGSRSA